MNFSSQFKNKTMLVVEDDQSSRLLIKHFLEKMEIKVLDAETGESALEILEREKVQGLLLDIALGAGINGVDLGKKIKSKRDYTHTPMIAVTTYDKLQLDDLEKNGFTGYLQKPYSSEQLLELLESQKLKRKLIY